MKIVFLGTPAIACPSLKALAGAGHDILAVVTQPDRPAGRGRKIARCPAALLADELGLAVLQPAHVRELAGELAALGPEMLAVVAFGQILPPAVLAVAPLGAVNVHTSLLPALRGAAPIQRAIMNGLARTGVTTMYMDQGLDTGDVILQEAVEIGPQDTAASLGERLGRAGAALLARTAGLIALGQAPRAPQDHARASLAPPLSKEEGRVDWTRPARELDWLVRGADPWPGAFTLLEGQSLKLFGPTLALPEAGGAAPGTLLEAPASARGLMLVACGAGALGLSEVQAAGKRRMQAGDFLRGARLAPGTRLGE
jgi:methionyl-tRNA formyltransferase